MLMSMRQCWEVEENACYSVYNAICTPILFNIASFRQAGIATPGSRREKKMQVNRASLSLYGLSRYLASVVPSRR